MGKKGDKLTQAATEICAEVVATLSPLGQVGSKKMFGGHGIFENGTMFALVDSAGDVFLKAAEANQARFEAAGSARHGRMPYFAVPVEVLEDADALRDWAKTSIEVAHNSKKK